jgi:formylglycine-generating enzyme required for sulfatase activity
MSQVRIFVSHHHSPEEDAFTARLVADLQSAGADVWVDIESIPTGSFVAKISEGLEGRQWLVLVMTPAALASPWVRSEVETALDEYHAGRMLGVIPFVMSPCTTQDIPVLWRKLQRYDATQEYVLARDSLLRALNLPVSARQSSMPQPRTMSNQAPQMVPIRQQPSPAAVWVPPRMVELGFAARVIRGTEVIMPPMVRVVAGEFLMGSDKRQDSQAYDDEQPQHRVHLPAYQIARFPVTVAEYACFVRAGGKEPAASGGVDWKTQLTRLDHPVVCVSWRDAMAYAAWLVQLTGQSWRLPTEAEWEKAARSTDGRIYPWGNRWYKMRCNSWEGGSHTTTPVGSYPDGTSPCGALDMAGNVWEWTSTLKKPYPYGPNDGRENPDSIGSRILRGGSWNDYQRDARTAYRGMVDPLLVYHVYGIRVVRSTAAAS